MNAKLSKEILIAILALTLISVGIYFSVQNFGNKEREKVELVSEDEDSLGEELFNLIKNPTSEFPKTNPFEEDMNPFEKEDTNPFDSYVNPFE